MVNLTDRITNRIEIIYQNIITIYKPKQSLLSEVTIKVERWTGVKWTYVNWHTYTKNNQQETFFPEKNLRIKIEAEFVNEPR